MNNAKPNISVLLQCIFYMVAFAACGPVEQVQEAGLTGFNLRLGYDTAIDQITIESTAFETITTPDPPEVFAPDGEDIVVLLPDDLGGTTIRITVSGLWGNRLTATAEREVSLVEEEIVLTAIQLVEVSQ